MTRTQIIIYVVVGLIVAIIAGCFAFIPALNGDDPNETGGGTTDTNVSIQIPTDTSDTPTVNDVHKIVPAETTVPDSEVPPATTEPCGTAYVEGPKVEEYTEEDVKDKITEVGTTETEDKVVIGEKDKNTQQTGPTAGEDRNDVIIKEKEELAPKNDDEQKDAEEKDEQVTVGEGKGEVIEKDEDSDIGGGNKNAPQYIPSVGGDNPFDDDTKTEIKDKPVDDYIGEGENRPGEGIHF